MATASGALARLPPRALPLLYFGTAHASLAAAAFFVGWSPLAVAGFFYHSWMVAIVHLVTLGWITLSILGAIYIVGPAALRMAMPAGSGDYIAYAVAVIGIIGMIGHFWIEEFSGMAWSGGTVAAGVLYVASRMAWLSARAPIPAGVKLHLSFAALNIALAATMGIILGFDKEFHFLPGFVLSNVFAHAHLAAVGWATMMVVGVGYRLLPMMLPSKAPEGRSLFVSAVLIETGVLGLFATLIARSSWSRLFGLLIVGGLASFVLHVVQMARTPRPRPPAAPAVDFAVLHVAAAGLSLACSIAIGVYLLFAEPTEWTLRAALAYGVFGLIGFLSQMVVAMETRLIPLFTWYRAYAQSNFKVPPPSPFVMRDRFLQTVVFVAWVFASPALAAGFFFNAVPLLAAGAWALFAGVLIGAFDNAVVVSRVFSSARW